MADTELTALPEIGAAITDTDVAYGVDVSAPNASVKILYSRVKTYTSASPTLVTPVLGVATATSINKVALTAPATAATLTIADGKTLTASNTLTLTGTDASSVAFGTGGTVLYSGGALGTPSSGTLTNCSGLPIAGIASLGTGVATGLGNAVNTNGGLVTASTASIASGAILTGGGSGTAISAITPGTGVSTFLATPSSANLAAAVTDETGTGALVFANTPTLVTPVLGVATATSVNKVAITAPATSATLTVADGKTLTASNSITLAGTDSTTTTFPPASASIGYLNLPANSQTAAYTTVLADSGKHIIHPASDNNARTFTIDSNANVAYALGTVLTFINMINTVTIAITSDTLTLAGAGTTGSRTLAANGIATAIKVDTTSWLISGTGLT